MSATRARYWLKRRLQIGLVGERADAEKAVYGRQGNSQGGGIPEAGEHVFETREIVRRPVRPARLLFFLRAAGQDDVRVVDPGR